MSNVLTMVAECEADLARMKTREGMKVARHHRSAAGQAAHGQPEATNPPRGPARGGQHTISAVEELFCLARSTVYRAFARGRSRAVS